MATQTMEATSLPTQLFDHLGRLRDWHCDHTTNVASSLGANPSFKIASSAVGPGRMPSPSMSNSTTTREVLKVRVYVLQRTCEIKHIVHCFSVL